MDRETDAVVSNSHLRHTLVAIRQVLGEKGAKDIYKSVDLDAFLVSFPPDDLNVSVSTQEYARILQKIETTYGLEGEGILRRIGRASFHLVLREQPTRMKSAKIFMGILPEDQRLQLILEPIVDVKEKLYPHGKVWLEEKERTLAVIEQNCLECYQQQSTRPICHLTSGMIDEALLWSTGQSIVSRETDCIAMGDAYCRFEVRKSLPQKSST